MLRTYKLSPSKVRYTPILEVIRRRAAELEREAVDHRSEGRRIQVPHPFSATA
jgi:hypothetical protein